MNRPLGKHRWLRQALNFTIRDTNISPKVVYVLIHVSNAHSCAPLHTVHIDPHWLYDGGMRVASDLEIVLVDSRAD